MSESFFLNHLGQTNQQPFLIHVERAEGSYFFDKSGKPYLDMISGVSVNNIGHRHPKVVKALEEQLKKYLHVMVYGEFIQDAQNDLARRLCSFLPQSLDMVYPVNSGTEAIEAALKLAKRYTNRTEIISFRGSYHGSTHGSMSVSGNEVKKQAYRPLLPDVQFLPHNDISSLNRITEKTAGVILETVQGDAGVRIPDLEFMKALRKRCDETGAQLILDEIQCGMGRTGKMFAFEHFQIVPDILTLGKALGGGMSIGAVVSSKVKMWEFTHNPMLGHITTFGGHPMNCAAAAACLEVFQAEINWEHVEKMGAMIAEKIGSHPKIKATRRIGMMFAFDMENDEQVAKVVSTCLERGVLTFWFLSHPYSFRLSPPLNISEEEAQQAVKCIVSIMDEIE